MNKNVPVEDLAPTILVGTFREANAKWIEEKKLYNLPLPKGYHYEQYNRFTHIVLWGRKGEPIAYMVKIAGVHGRKWLRENGYATTSSPHGDEYVVFSLGRKVNHERILSDPTADVFVCSSRYTGRIDKDFYARPLPQCGGRSIPNIFEKLRPFVTKWHDAFSFDPVQMDFLQALHRAGLLALVDSKGRKLDDLSKPEKIYVSNTNLMHALVPHVDSGVARETFFFSQTKMGHAVTYTGVGDFVTDGKWTFEVGGKGKGFDQIADLPRSYVVNDGISVGRGNKIPLWLFGFLY